MSEGLFGFIYNTLLEQVNNPNNSAYWLPHKLDQLTKSGGGLLLPIQATSWDIGNITGNSGTAFQLMIADQWWLYLGSLKPPPTGMSDHQAIGCPTEPWPHLLVPQATINGLDNVLAQPDPVMTESANGYHAVITLQFGYYAGQNGLPTLSQVQVQGQYSLSQCLCTSAANAKNPTACDGWNSENITGNGTFSLTMTHVFIEATVDILVQGTGAGRTLQVVLDNLTMRGPQPGALPTLTVDQSGDPPQYDLTLESKLWVAKNIWVPKAVQALESEDGVQGIVTNINTTLNEPNNISQLARMLNQQLNNVLDQALGSVPAGQLPSGVGQQTPNPVDQYLFDRVRFMVNSPDSDYYLPKTIYGFTNPELEPFQADTISLGAQSYSGLDFQSVDLNSVTMTGLSNAAAPPGEMNFPEPNANATLYFSTLNPPPVVTIEKDGSTVSEQVPAPPMTITGQFAMTPQGEPQPLTGGFNVTVNRSSLAAAAAFSGDVIDDLVITFTQMKLSAASSDINVSVDIDSAFKQIVNQLLNQDSVKQTFVAGLNNVATQKLGLISKTATDNVKQLVKSRLGG
jgi:hypothetical protein